MEKLSTETEVTVGCANKLIEFLVHLVGKHDLDFNSYFSGFKEDFMLLDPDDIVEPSVVDAINHVYDEVIEEINIRYIEAKRQCHLLQVELQDLVLKLQNDLPTNYPPAYVFDLNLVIDVFHHREYLENYIRDLRAYGILAGLRKQHATIKPQTTKANVVSLVPKDFH